MIGIRRTEGPIGPIPERRRDSLIQPVEPVAPVVSREPNRDSVDISEAALELLRQSQPDFIPDELPEDEAKE